jgi:hypothetical protein
MAMNCGHNACALPRKLWVRFDLLIAAGGSLAFLDRLNLRVRGHAASWI